MNDNGQISLMAWRGSSPKGKREGTQMDLMREYWLGTVEAARAGDVEAARDALEDFAEAVENVASFREPEKAWSGPIPWQIAEYLTGAFRQILNGTDPTHALNLVGKQRGRRKGKSVTHNLDALAASFWLLRRNGLSVEEANKALRRELGADRATVYRARKEYQAYEFPKLINDEILKVALRPYAAKVKTILESRRTKSTNSRSRK